MQIVGKNKEVSIRKHCAINIQPVTRDNDKRSTTTPLMRPKVSSLRIATDEHAHHPNVPAQRLCRIVVQ